MLRSYLISSFRYLLNNRSYATLNVIGLSVGIACFTLIGLWVSGELSYDRFHTNSDRIYRVSGIFTSESDHMQQAVTPTPLRTALKTDLPEVENAVILDENGAIIKRGDKQFNEDGLFMTDPSFLDIFSFQLKAGDKNTALNEPYSIILSETLAAKYFGSEDPLGKDLTIFLQDPDGQGIDYNVTGIIEDCPDNSHFEYQALISFSTLELNNPANPHGYDWYNNGYYTYILLHEGTNPQAVEKKLGGIVDQYMGKHNREWKISYEYFLQPLTDIHLHSNIKYEIQPTSSMSNIIVFATIGLIVLVLACINYVNLATAFSAGRFKEVGMRKLMGAFQKQLVGRYLTESLILAFASLALAMVWIELSRPLFEGLTGKPILHLYSIQTLLILISIAGVVGIFAGFYPAILLSSFHPVNIIKGQLKSGTAGVWLRKSLVVLQYSITIVLVVGILAVNRQLDFMKSQDLGFNQNGLLVMGVNGSQEVIENYDGFANELRSLPFVEGVARSNTTLAGGLGNSIAEMEDANGKQANATVYRVRTDFDYLDTYQMTLVSGRFFQKDNAADSSQAFVVNESLARAYGYTNPDDILGKPFQFQGRNGKVIGVVRDFHYNSLQYNIDPTCLSLLSGGYSRVSVRLTGDLYEARNAVAALWRKHFPNTMVDSRFAEESLNAQYDSEQRFSKIFIVFSVISLAIACLGLFALVSFSVESRTKEIGIRKVLGASSAKILAMFSREFLVLIAISATISIPVGYYLVKEWLAGFAYRMDLNPLIFAAASLLVMIIAWATITIRTAQTSTSNPIDSLRME